MSDEDKTLLTDDNTGVGGDDKSGDDKSGDDKSGDDKSGDDKSGDDKSGDDKSGDDKGAPDEYAEFTLPEGMDADKVALEAFKPLAKELNLTQEQAQKLIDMQAKHVQSMVDDEQARVDALSEKWVEEVKTDDEIGGADYKEKVGVAVKALGRFGSNELRSLLDDSGLGNHPEVIRLLYKVGKAIAEDKFVEGDKEPKTKPFYDKSNHVR